MRANREYELKVTRGPRFHPDRTDHIEVLEVATGEIVLFWDTLPNQTRKLARALKTDLAGMEGEDFVVKWERYGG